MKTLMKFSLLLLLTLFAVSCERDHDDPPLNEPVYNGEAPNITIKGLKEKYAGVTTTPQLIDEDLILRAYVSGNDISGNIYKQLIIQDNVGDETYSLPIGIDYNSIYTDYRVGQEIYISLKGLYMLRYGGEIQIGYKDTQANRISDLMLRQHVQKNGWPDLTKVEAKAMSIAELTSNVNLVNTLIQLDNVYFVEPVDSGYARYQETVNRTLKDLDGNSITVRTSGYSDFALNKLPDGVGSIIGIAGRYNGTWQFTIRSIDDVLEFSGDKPDGGNTGGAGTGTKEDPYDISAAIAKQGEKDVWVKGYIVGAVKSGGVDINSESQFVGPFTGNSNIILALSPDETNPAKCFPVQLTAGAIREAVNLVSNPGNHKKEVKIKGELIKYFGLPGLKTPTDYVLDGQGGGTVDPDPDPEPSEGEFFSETFGTTARVDNFWPKVGVYTDFDMKAPIAYADQYNNADVRSTSTITSSIWLPANKDAELSITGIESGYKNIVLTYDIATNVANTDVNVITVACNGTLVTVPSQVLAETNKFVTISLTLPDNTTSIRFYAAATVNASGMRLDNIKIKGTK